MNTEQAIKIIECFFRESDNKCANGECDFASPMCQYDRESAFEIALSALREQAERSRGCEYCRGWDKRCGASYCPMCGKRLEAQHEQN